MIRLRFGLSHWWHWWPRYALFLDREEGGRLLRVRFLMVGPWEIKWTMPVK